MTGVPLLGGTANVGSVVRVGDTVRRPSHSSSELVQAFLRHLREAGVERVPEPLGFDEDGREVLVYIPGEAAHPAFGPDGVMPSWAATDETLIEIAVLQRQLHDAAASFRVPSGVVWNQAAGNYFPPSSKGSLLCHNDICVANVVFEQGAVVGLVDFDYLRPVDRLFDIAVAARHWVPLVPPTDLNQGIQHVDPIERFHVFCEAHELVAGARRTVIDFAIEFLELARLNVPYLAEQGVQGFIDLVEAGYDDHNRRAVDWLRLSARRLVA